MKLHLSWRLIALAIILLLFYLLAGKLLTNSLYHQNVRYTLDLADTDIQVVTAAFQVEGSFTTLQEIIKSLPENNQNLNSVAVVYKRNFAAHSDTTLIGSSITKEIFDRQREISKNYDASVADSHYL